VKFLSRVFTALNFEPSMATLALVNNPNPRQRSTKRAQTFLMARPLSLRKSALLSLEEACARYQLTVDEFLSWQRSIDKHGLAGLRATRIQDYRN
jgi:hypothetical protein